MNRTMKKDSVKPYGAPRWWEGNLAPLIVIPIVILGTFASGMIFANL
jgi:hypothetical protein